MPKSLIEPGKELAAALREFAEEPGIVLSARPRRLTRVHQAGGKWGEAFAMQVAWRNGLVKAADRAIPPAASSVVTE